MLFNNPISSRKADQIISVLDLSTDDHVLDVGCGTGEMLIRIIENASTTGHGIDIDPKSISAAQANAAGRISQECEFRVADIRDESLEEESFSLAMCIGATHAFDAGRHAYPATIEQLSRLVRPGGSLLIGEGYWKQPPEDEYLKLIGDPVGIYRSHQENITLGEQHGLITLYAIVSSEDEWDHFEWSHAIRIERQAAAAQDDPETTAKLQRSREWRRGYLRWGRSTMGFGFYLFQKPMPVS